MSFLSSLKKLVIWILLVVLFASVSWAAGKEYRHFEVSADLNRDGGDEQAYVSSTGSKDLTNPKVPKFLVISKDGKVIFKEPLKRGSGYITFTEGYIQIFNNPLASTSTQEQCKERGIPYATIIAGYPLIIVCFHGGSGDEGSWQFFPKTGKFRYVRGGD